MLPLQLQRLKPLSTGCLSLPAAADLCRRSDNVRLMKRKLCSTDFRSQINLRQVHGFISVVPELSIRSGRAVRMGVFRVRDKFEWHHEMIGAQLRPLFAGQQLDSTRARQLITLDGSLKFAD